MASPATPRQAGAAMFRRARRARPGKVHASPAAAHPAREAAPTRCLRRDVRRARAFCRGTNDLAGTTRSTGLRARHHWQSGSDRERHLL